MFSSSAVKYFSARNYFLGSRLPGLFFTCGYRTEAQYGENHSSIFDQLRQMDRNYASIKNNYAIKTPEYFNFAHDFVDRWAEIDKNEKNKPIAFWFVYKNGQEVKWTYEELSQRTQKTANALKNLGAGTKWKRCLVIIPKLPEWWLINLACIRLGVVLIPTSAQATSKDIQYRLNSSKSQCILTVSKIADAVDLVQPLCPTLNTKILVNPDGTTRSGWENFKHHYDKASDQHRAFPTKSSDILQIFFTSGTTSLPKKVVRCHAEGPLGIFSSARYVCRLDRGNVFWCTADTGWSMTFGMGLLCPWLTGATSFVHEMPIFDLHTVLNVLRDYPVDTFCSPPTVYRLILGNPIPKFKNLKTCLSGGEPLDAETVNAWSEKTGIQILDAYGQSETAVIIAGILGERYKVGSMGIRIPGSRVDIVDDNGKILPIGEKGHIGIKVKPERPIGLFKEYEDDPVKSSKCIAGDYYLTGDRAHEDEDGYFWYDCRADDVITSSGYRIGPFEVETALHEHPDVLESGVIGVPDTETTEIIKAYVVLKESGKKKNPDELIKELQEHVKKITAPYKYPRQIEFVDALPKTLTGKVKRSALREKAIKKKQLRKSK